MGPGIHIMQTPISSFPNTQHLIGHIRNPINKKSSYVLHSFTMCYLGLGNVWKKKMLPISKFKWLVSRPFIRMSKRFHQRTGEAGQQLPGPLPFHRSWRSVSGNWGGPHNKKVRQKKRWRCLGKQLILKDLHFLSFFDILFLDDWCIFVGSKAVQLCKSSQILSIFHLSPGCCAATRLNLNDCWHNDLTPELCCLILACSTSSKVWRQEDIPENTWARRYVCTETFQVGVGHQSPSGAAHARFIVESTYDLPSANLIQFRWV